MQAAAVSPQKGNDERIDVKENRLLQLDSVVFETLLKDRTTGKNILWGTDNYLHYGKEYAPDKQILKELITGRHGEVIRPRVKKSKSEQKNRVKQKAEVFTPSWVCKLQNDYIDDAWFGKKSKSFPTKDGKTWSDYIKMTWLEIACGEAPYIVNRYDATTSDTVTLLKRIGFLDMKLKIIFTECKTKEDWIKWTKIAYQSCYGFEWQGDNLLLARENLLYTFSDYYEHKFRNKPDVEVLREIAEIISWNIWQMDGLTYCIPNTEKEAMLMDWETNEPTKFAQIATDSYQDSLFEV
ncbi:MAG: restriction endonuclease subunit M [Bifidobacteriaceae bacterium]|jgi:hypothetical protein|nr:restriction endonuclease subunit M [Bifidobacteriaceae bacterium]